MRNSIKTSLTISDKALQQLKTIRKRAAYVGFPCDTHEDTLSLLFKVWTISEENGVVKRLLTAIRSGS